MSWTSDPYRVTIGYFILSLRPISPDVLVVTGRCTRSGYDKLTFEHYADSGLPEVLVRLRSSDIETKGAIDCGVLVLASIRPILVLFALDNDGNPASARSRFRRQVIESMARDAQDERWLPVRSGTVGGNRQSCNR